MLNFSPTRLHTRKTFVYRSLLGSFSPYFLAFMNCKSLHCSLVLVSWEGETIYQASTNHQLDLFSGWATTTAIKGQEQYPLPAACSASTWSLVLHSGENPNFWHYPKIDLHTFGRDQETTKVWWFDATQCCKSQNISKKFNYTKSDIWEQCGNPPKSSFIWLI